MLVNPTNRGWLPKIAKYVLLDTEDLLQTSMEQKAQQATPVMHRFKEEQGVSVGKALFLFVLSACLGVGSGWAMVTVTRDSAGNVLPAPTAENAVVVGQSYGSADTKLFRDTTEGTLAEGGIDGEGQYHLVRSGGESQNVYLTSSTVDLSLFVGRKIKIAGQTQEGQKAGWLMDVGRVEVLE